MRAERVTETLMSVKRHSPTRSGIGGIDMQAHSSTAQMGAPRPFCEPDRARRRHRWMPTRCAAMRPVTHCARATWAARSDAMVMEATGWLCRDAGERERLLDMSRRLRPAK